MLILFFLPNTHFTLHTLYSELSKRFIEPGLIIILTLLRITGRAASRRGISRRTVEMEAAYAARTMYIYREVI